MTATAPVAVTGLGVVGPLGVGTEATFTAALEGRHGFQRIPDQVGGSWPVAVWAPVQDELPEVSRQELRAHDRSGALALQAVREAWRQAGSPPVDGERLSVSFSAGMAGAGSVDAAYTRYLSTGGTLASTVPRTMPNAPAAALAIELGAHAGTYSLVSACASGADAIAHGARLIATGETDVVVTGGTEAVLLPIPVLSFAAIRALSQQRDPARACRPFDRQREGFVLGEGAAVLVLESLAHAEARNATILALLSGTGVTSDAHHLVAPDPSGRQAARAMTRALSAAGVGPSGVAAVNAHATGTRAGDAAEAAALAQVFGAHLERLPVTGLKSMLGHLVGAAGPVAAAMAVQSLRSGLLPPTPSFEAADPGVSLTVPTDRPAKLADGAIMVNSFGFGGHNVTLCFAPSPESGDVAGSSGR